MKKKKEIYTKTKRTKCTQVHVKNSKTKRANIYKQKLFNLTMCQ